MTNPSPGRDVYVENARFVLIALVVSGHLLEPFLWRSTGARAAYALLYLFHMPLFAALSGRLSSATRRPGDHRKLLTRLVFPYLVAQVALLVFDRFVLGGSTPFSLVRPYWVLWFLLSLVWWRAVLPYLPPMRWALPAAICVALGAGFVERIGYDYSLSRTLVFLPFFLLGHASRGFDVSTLVRFRAPALAMLVLAAAAASHRVGEIDASFVRVLYGSFSYEALGLSGAEGPLLRAASTVAAVLLSLAVLAWVPARRTFFTERGARTLTVLVLHVFFVRGLEALGAFGRLQNPLLWAGLGVGVAYGLSFRSIDAWTGRVLSPGWLERLPIRPAPRGAGAAIRTTD